MAGVSAANKTVFVVWPRRAKIRIMLIGCRASRVSPEVIVDAEPGELIIARKDPAGVPLDDYIECLALASVVQDLAKLRTFPWIAKREQLGKLGLHGEPISASPRPRCSRSTGVSGRFEPSRPGRFAPPLPGRPHRA
jgi:carbonic anhydrase